MLSNPLRAAVLAGVLSLVVLAGSVASASAEVTASQIASPASPTYALYDETVSSPPPAFTVEGTTTGSGSIALRCYYGGEAKSYVTVAEKVTPVEVTPSAGSFKVEVQPKSLYSGPCVLRAVPFENAEAHAPGAPSEEAGDPFQGPRIVGSRFELFPENNNHYSYEVESSTLSGYFDIQAAGECGLEESKLYAGGALTPSKSLFACDAFIYPYNFPPSGKTTRSELQIDGANAYSPAAAHLVEESELKVKAPLPGAPQTTVTKFFNPLTGLVTLTEVDPIVKCSPETVYPPTSTSCTSFVSTGVQLERTWQTSEANHVAQMTDTWRSTDGAAHSLNALYGQDLDGEEKAGGGSFEFPGAAFSPTTNGQTVPLPPGAGTIYYKEDAETPAGGDGQHPQGAIVYDSPPSEPAGFNLGSEKANFTRFEMPYRRTIPGGGAATMRMAFVQAYELPQVESLAKAVLASYPPALTIAAPANGATVTSPSVTVSGTATDTGALASLTVNGQAVSVGAGGAWSASVALSVGANTIKVLATDQAGLSTERSVSVTRRVVVGKAPPPHPARASEVGSVSVSGDAVSFTIACTGTAGQRCEVESTLTTIERTRNGRLVAVFARRHHHHRNRSIRVTVGFSKLTIPAGQRVTITIQLNAAGRSLLARFGALPVHLTVRQVGARRATIIAQNLLVRPHHRRRHHHHHHHR